MRKSRSSRREQFETLKRVWRYVRRYRLLLFASFALATATTLTTLYIPRLIGAAVDLLVGPEQVDFDGIGVIMTKVFVCACAVGVGQAIMAAINNRIAYNTSRDARNEAFAKLGALPLKYVDERAHGEIVSRIITDAEQFADGLLLGVAQLFTGVVTIVGVLVFMLSVNFKIAIVVVALTPASFLVAGVISRRSFWLFRRQTKLRGAETGFINETIQGLKVVRAFNREEASEERFNSLDEEFAAASLKATFISSLTNPATRFVNSLVYMSVGLVGAFSVVSGATTVGSLVVFLSYAEQYTKPFNEISSVATEFQNALACAERIFELIDEPPEEPDPVDAVAPEKAEGRVEFDAVRFSYWEDRPLIEDFNLSVPHGARVAIVGPTGCGKTTLVNLLMRFYEVDSGQIRLDGIDERHMVRGALRSLYGMVLQDTWLKQGTIRENILMGASNVSDEEFHRIAVACRVEPFVRRLPKRYETIVSENGAEFSQGQRQLICIARVMARKPDVLILDEATSSIDTRAEQKIQEAFHELMTGRSSFVVAHRLSTIRSADIILAMRDGRIVERGSHEELMANRGFYYELYTSQFRE